MQFALALMPSAVVLVAILGFRASGVVASTAALVTAAGLALSGSFTPFTPAAALQAAIDAGIVTLLVAAMIVPGILFVEATRKKQAPEAIAGLIDAFSLSRPQAAIVIATGIGVMVESLTGMGVSLLITMPLLLGLFEKRSAIGIGLVGMSLMPWGALSISAHVGAKLSGIGVETLQGWIAAVSGPVAFCLPLLALLFVPGWRARDFATALAAGGFLAGAITLSSRCIGVEVAGVIGGLAIILLAGALSSSRAAVMRAARAPGLRPYLTLLLAVIVQKLSLAPLARAGFWPVIASEKVSFAVLTSPGVALLIATVISASSELRHALFQSAMARAWRPVLGIALFMLAARLLVECGAIEVLGAVLGGLGRTGGTIGVALLGAVGGFVTGSGVTGNALFMPSAAAAGEALGVKPVLAALQNAASGHVSMAAIPVGAILIAALGQRQAGDEGKVMRLGLLLGAWHLAVATLAALFLIARLF